MVRLHTRPACVLIYLMHLVLRCFSPAAVAVDLPLVCCRALSWLNLLYTALHLCRVWTLSDAAPLPTSRHFLLAHDVFQLVSSAVKKITSQKLEFKNWLKLRERNFENVTLVARRRGHIQVFLVIVLVAQLPPKTGMLLPKNSLTSCQQYRQVESRTLTCPFKQSNMSAWSLLSWHPTHTCLWGRLCFIHVVCTPLSRSRRVIQIMPTEALLLNAYLESFSPLMYC